MTEGENIRVMIVDDIYDTREQLSKLLFFEKDIEVVAQASNGREAVALAKQYRPDVILMDINMPDMDGIAATEAIMTQDPGIQVIIMSVQGETDYLRRAMLAGAREFLTKPISADDLYKSIRHVHALASSRPRVAMQNGVVGTDETSRSGGQGQILAVFSPKGGVGTSVVAANLAVALRQQTTKKVALVDANIVFGAQDVVLNLVANRTIVDLAERIGDLDRDLLNDVLVTHNTQVKVLLAPPDPQRGELITSDHLRTILELMRHEYEYVVVDTHSSFQDRTLAVLDVADRIITLMTLEMTCIKNIRQFLEVADLLAYEQEKVMLVLNRADNRMGIRVSNVEESIRRKVSLQIVNGGNDIALAVNHGVPLVIEKPNHPATRDIMALAREVSNVTKVTASNGLPVEKENSGRKNGLFSRLLAKR